nr:LysR substrate-binding domain-containing protein [Pseudomonas sp. FFPRI_1]
MNSPISALSATLDLQLLRTFLCVVDAHSFALAADWLALTPSAVSGHIKRLEDNLGVKLLARTTRRLELTAQGETLYAYGRNILNLEREVRAKLTGSPLQGRLRVGASEDFASTWLPYVLQSFSRAHPQASVELKVGVTSELLQFKDLGHLDLVFGKQCRRVEQEGELLWEEPLVWAYSSQLSLDPLSPLPLAVFPEPCVYRESAVDALSQGQRAWRLAFESSSMAGCIAAALAGFAVTPIARSQLREGLCELGSEQALPELAVARFYAFAEGGSPAVRALVASVREWGKRKRFVGDSRI